MIFGVAMWQHTRQTRAALLFGLLSALGLGLPMGGVVMLLFNRQVGGSHLTFAFGVGALFYFSALFILTYTLTRPLVGPQAAALIGAIAAGIGHFPYGMVISFYDPWQNMGTNLGLVILGVTMHRWRPLITLPLEQFWNRRLFALEKRRQSTPFHGHAAFWDELQFRPFPGLADHILLRSEHDPRQARLAIDYLAAGYQRPAAQEALIELEARRLEQCADLSAISHCHRDLITGEIMGFAGGLLHEFKTISYDVAAALNQVTLIHQRLALTAILERLMNFADDLAKGANLYTARFLGPAQQWLTIIGAAEQALSARQALGEELPNPYIFSVPLTIRHATYVRRQELARQINALLQNPAVEIIMLTGQRRIGKTSLLSNLGRLLPAQQFALFIDGEKIAMAVDVADSLYNLAREIAGAAKRQGFSLQSPAIEFFEVNPMAQFTAWLTILSQQVNQAGFKQTIILLDELDALVHILNTRRLSRSELASVIIGLATAQPALKLVLSGSDQSEVILREVGRTCRVEKVTINRLNRQETSLLIDSPDPDSPLKFDPAAKGRVYDLTRGHPHLIQLLCHEAVNLKNLNPVSPAEKISPQEIEAAIPHVFEVGHLFFVDLAHTLPAGAQAALPALARLGPDGGTAEDWPLHQIEEEVFERLLQRGLIERTQERYVFQVELIRRWFTRIERGL